MESVPRILTSVSQGWVAWLMLLTLIGLAFSKEKRTIVDAAIEEVR